VSEIEDRERTPSGDPVAAWIDPALQGDAGAMRSLLAALAPVVMRAARRLLGRGHPDVDDVAQQALVGVIERLPGFRGESSLGHFAERIAVYRALTARRDERFRQRLAAEAADADVDDGGDPESPFAIAASRARLALLREALDAVSPPQAEALALHFLFDRTIAEIAAMTDSAEETVRSRLRLGKQALRTKIEKDGRFRALREGVVENTVAPPAGKEEEP
jgi:RNA polymerase sigma factor (sigma-70 family)